jgi:hypothetical protein
MVNVTPLVVLSNMLNRTAARRLSCSINEEPTCLTPFTRDVFGRLGRFLRYVGACFGVLARSERDLCRFWHFFLQPLKFFPALSRQVIPLYLVVCIKPILVAHMRLSYSYNGSNKVNLSCHCMLY